MVISRSWLVTLTSVHFFFHGRRGCCLWRTGRRRTSGCCATIITGSLPSTTEAPSAELGEVKEEQPDYSDPADTPEVETVNLLGLEESEPSLTTTTPVEEGAAPSAPAEPSVEATVIEGAGPSAPSRPPRTRGARGGKDTQHQKLKRAYYSGYDKARTWLANHTRPRPNRPGFSLPKIDFEVASARLQELLVNWEYFVSRASAQQLLCELELVSTHFAQWVSHNGYQGEGPQLAGHLRNQTLTLSSLIEGASDAEQTYSQLWEEEEAGQQDRDELQPHRARVRGGSRGKAQGAASSAPSGRSSSISGWIGREYIPDEEGKGKGSKGKWVPKNTSAPPTETSVPSPKTPEGPPPPHHPRQPNTPPPNRDPQVGKVTSLIPPPPPSTPPTVFIPPRPKSRPPIVRTPPHRDLLTTHPFHLLSLLGPPKPTLSKFRKTPQPQGYLPVLNRSLRRIQHLQRVLPLAHRRILSQRKLLEVIVRKERRRSLVKRIPS